MPQIKRLNHAVNYRSQQHSHTVSEWQKPRFRIRNILWVSWYR